MGGALNFRARLFDDELRIDAFANSAKIVALKGRFAKRLADLTLHLKDLQFAESCLKDLARVHEQAKKDGTVEQNKVIIEALWRSATVSFFKCFGSSGARGSISEKKVLRDQPIMRRFFKDMKHIRDKNIVHDENSMAVAMPGAIINEPGAQYRVEKIFSFTAIAGSLSPHNYYHLMELVRLSSAWVRSELDELTVTIIKDLQTKSDAELMAMEDLRVKIAKAKEVAQTRETL